MDSELAQLRPQLERALTYAGGTHTLADVTDGIAAGRYQLWPGTRSVVVTEVQIYPRKKLLCFFLAAGELPELRRMLPFILAWGRDQQHCDRAVIIGRAGWVRTFLTQEHWRPRALVLEKDL